MTAREKFMALARKQKEKREADSKRNAVAVRKKTEPRSSTPLRHRVCPSGFIDLKSAMSKYNITRHVAMNLVKKGLVESKIIEIYRYLNETQLRENLPLRSAPAGYISRTDALLFVGRSGNSVTNAINSGKIRMIQSGSFRFLNREDLIAYYVLDKKPV